VIFDTVNKICREIYENAVYAQISMEYDAYVDEMSAQFELLEYSARSYDLDAVSYGFK
jgi:hypothetical protein